MQTIGLIGGMSWESTALYYKLINERVRDRMGKLHSAPLLLYSYDFQEIKEMQYAGRWAEAAASLAEVAELLENAGARAIEGGFVCRVHGGSAPQAAGGAAPRPGRARVHGLPGLAGRARHRSSSAGPEVQPARGRRARQDRHR